MQIKCYNCFLDYDDANEVCPHCGHDPKSARREANHLPRGTVLNDRYLIGEVAGFGGFGITYKAWDQKLEIIVAVKEYFPNGSVNRVPGTENVVLFSGKRLTEFQFGLERFIEEARTTAKYVTHKNIVNVYDYFEANRTAYIVMEYLDGISLEHYLVQFDEGKKRVDIETAVDITLSICNALKTIHADGIIHRDISPDNIFLCLNGIYKLYDFGAARFTQDENRRMTIILKPGYAPPEQYEKVNKQGPWTDIYALGATLYRMVTGVKPVESINRKIQDELLEPNQIVPEIPQYLNDAIMKAMAIEQHLRFQTVEELEKVLKQEKAVESPKVTIQKKKVRRIAGITAAAAVLLAGAGIAGWNVYQEKTLYDVKPASIEIWYVAEESTLGDALDAIQEQFCEDKEGVSITFKAVPAAVYEQQLQDAAQAGELPALFQSDTVSVKELDILPLRPSMRVLSETLDNCYFLDANKSAIQASGKLPTGFTAPVFYLNTVRCSYEGDSVSSLKDVLGNDGTLAAPAANRELLETLYPDNSYEVLSPELFFGGGADLYFSETAEFYEVQEVLPARSAMLPLQVETLPCQARYCWSLGDRKNKDEEKLARRFLENLVSDSAQDCLYVQQQTPALPLNKAEAAVYQGMYPEFGTIFANADHYTLKLEEE